MNLLDHLEFWLRPIKEKGRLGLDTLTVDESRRLDHYIKLRDPFVLSQATPVNTVSPFSKTGYAYDWYRLFDRSDSRLCHLILGDVSYAVQRPTFCKSRPLLEGNHNNVILPLNTVRHLQFVDDRISFRQKADRAVWRGAAYKDKRQRFLDVCAQLPLCDVMDTARRKGERLPRFRPPNYKSVREQLQYKFIFAIEGNDVATNLKWAMSSNSLVLMPRPTCETWFCEAFLEPGRHFVEIDPTYGDINDKLEYYLEHQREAEEIIGEANEYCRPFRDIGRQFAIGREVAETYFSLARI